ncbi:MmcQ/YjbR family DNA-binding protein [bacterium SCSIO 12741]|nr:MmcQ/YjbR family DNA-binding protein [bacterium SCSIO 12741]
MNIEEFRDYCLAKKGVTEELPFGPQTLVFKVSGKMFTACNIEDFVSYNVKCNPERALELREEYHGINPGYHMNKKHWNTIEIESDVSEELHQEMIDHSYDLVVKSLPKKDRELLMD